MSCEENEGTLSGLSRRVAQRPQTSACTWRVCLFPIDFSSVVHRASLRAVDVGGEDCTYAVSHELDLTPDFLLVAAVV